ncbi:hypothetical protein PFLUV_G00185250 [Perca fluviatilis]|uniref:Uncharacterized protein n=1 Tax=Perca fluviatilis TaxID=8168 RepID=A0A6A5EI73_PERFL|nr:hypothetical protein PFLUV_G00185250 [Perca fluviatilis]
MKISVSFTLWLLLGSVSTSENVEIQPASPPDVYAELRELKDSLAQLKADLITDKAELKAEVDRQKQQLQVRQVAFSASLEALQILDPFPRPLP